MDGEMLTQPTSGEGTISQAIIAPHQLYDPLLVVLKVKLRLNEWWIIAVMGVVAAVGLYSCLLLGLLTPLRVLSGALMVLLWTGLYLFLPSSMARLFNGLWDTGVIGEPQAHRREPLSYQSFVEQQARLIGSRWWVGIALFLLGLYWLYRSFFAHDVLTHTPWWVQLQVIFLYSVVVYCGFLSVVWLLSMVVATTRLFHTFTIQVKPLHSDGSGGLDLLNRFLWMGVTLMGIGVCGAIALGFASFSGDYGGVYSLVYILCYLITLPLLLSAWLALPHQVMVRARNALLQPLVEEYERAVRETIEWVVADARSFQLQKHFSLIYMLGNAFQLFLTRNDQEAMLERVREHLYPEGYFLFGTRNPSRYHLFEWGKAEQNIYTAPDGKQVIVTAHQEYDHLTQIQHHTFHTLHRNWPTSPQESEGKTTRLALRYVFPQEMEALLFHNGFEILSLYGDWDQQALTESSPRMIYVCQRHSSGI